MNKYFFGLIFILFISCQTHHFKDKPSFWLWLTINNNYSDGDIDKAIKKINYAGIKNIIVNTDSAGLEKIIRKAVRYDIDVYAWFIALNRNDLAKAHPEWLSVNHQGKSLAEQKAYVDYYKFLCPAIPEVRDSIKEKIKSLCKIKELKGIHLDYIRYVDAILPIGLWNKYNVVQDRVYPQFDYGYHPYLRQKYQQKYGIDPLKIKDSEHDKQWNQFRLDQVTELVFQIDTITKKYNKELTAAVFPTPAMSAKMVYQDWGKWPLDVAFPMLYHNFYNENINWIGKMVEIDTSTSHHGTKIVAGIFVPNLKEPGKISKAVNIALKNGASGISFFGLNPLEDDTRWEEIAEVIKQNKS